MVLAIVVHTVANTVQQALLADGFRVTRINTAGGFLRRGNVTLLAGVQTADADRAIAIVRSNAGNRGGWVMMADLKQFNRI